MDSQQIVAPVKQIGRFQFSVSHVAGIGERRLFGIGPRRYDVYLTNGRVLRLTPAEKAELDQANQLHGQTSAILEMIRRMQAFNRPAAG